MPVHRVFRVLFPLVTIGLLLTWPLHPVTALARSGDRALPEWPALDPLSTATADGAWSQHLPEGRRAPGVVYDSARDRMIVFGGVVRGDASNVYYNDVWTLSFPGGGGWSPLATTGTPPSARAELSCIYDAGMDRVLVFGGSNGVTFMNDVWALSLAGTPTWTHLTPGGTPPGVRAGQTAIYDAPRSRMIVFGGYNGSGTRFNDVRALSLGASPAWSTLTPTSPPAARGGHTAIFDAAANRMIVFGGYNGVSRYNDVLALALTGTPAWTSLAPAGTPPAPRQGAAAIYDPAGGRMLIFGGDDGSTGLTDTWSVPLTGSPSWNQLFPGSATPLRARAFGGAFYDPVRLRMMVFGGDDGMEDVVGLTLSGGLAWAPVAGPHGGRFGPMVVYDSRRNRVILFGGYDGETRYDDVWTLNVGTPSVWSSLTTSGTRPVGRSGEGGRYAFYDAVNDRMVLFGGNAGSSSHPVLLNDVWALSFPGNAWSLLTPTGGPPTARQGFAAAHDVINNRIVMFAGNTGTFDSPTFVSDAWMLSLGSTPGQTPAWSLLSPAGAMPGARLFMSSAWDPTRSRMVLFGGMDAVTTYNSVWALNLSAAPAWTTVATVGVGPGARLGASMDYDPVRDRMVLLGGWDGAAFLSDSWILTLAGTPTWSASAAVGTPPTPHVFAATMYDRMSDRMLFYGGDMASTAPGGLWSLLWGVSTGVDEDGSAAGAERLQPPAPNPGHGATMVSYSLIEAGPVQLGVFDVSGRLVRRLIDGERPAGRQTITWNGTDASGSPVRAGLYYVRISGRGFRQTRAVVLLR